MKYSSEIIIEQNLDYVIEKLDSRDNLKHWQKGLVKAEHISGTPGELGSKMKLEYDMDGRKMELIETVTKRNFPKEFHATYSTKGMHNHQENTFESTPEGFTKWISKNEFLPTSFFMRLMLVAMPGAFKKQSMVFMTNFKNFVENGTSVANA
ncbi:SRPBCC family protein [Winogradskyella maritima]|uniref:SRPBCC family protein n=1 Tax=Winogradskyella maritima TaxID=1517766 RepID=A0ABV8ALN4_9FLAO|nr:SRPBCC family protein [Winogradskyella maritima]